MAHNERGMIALNNCQIFNNVARDTPKTNIIIDLQARGHLTALSWVDSSSGPPNAPTWTSICKINGVPMATGSGSRKTIARDIAANEVLAALQQSDG